MFPPSPPGDTIGDIMQERRITRLSLGLALHITPIQVEDLLKGRFLIDNDMACRLSDYLGSTPDFWENREKQYREKLRQQTKEKVPA